ncbi:MAG TPA: N-acetylmuramoyl-L-alanine amidase [Gammaproteobacteria bacterium]|nr:N-acetylmuramoyl-L-alanine amidase [Gammaproteobacteria bacterium]
MSGRSMKKLLLLFSLPFYYLLLSGGVVADVTINGVRSWTAPERTRLVFDLSGPVKYQLTSSADTSSPTLLLKQSQLKSKIPSFNKHKVIASIVAKPVNKKSVQVTFKLRKAVKIKSFQLDPGGRYGYRLVLDLYAEERGRESKVAKKRSRNSRQQQRATSKADKRNGVKKQQTAHKRAQSPTPATAKKVRGRDIVIAIDAGHGGEDSGARGSEGTYEKDVVLAIANKLKKLLDKEAGIRGVLVRKSDYYIPLRKRMEIARKHHADFFVSIHADAFPDPSARGSSVYVLSNKGASSEAAHWLAKRENQADLVGGVSLDDKDDVLASVLLDLSQAASRQVSHEVAQMTVRNLHKAGKVHFSGVQKAGFAVLKSPDIPSMLVEVAFISNPMEEKKLRDQVHQEKFAQAILGGVRRHFHRAPPPGSWLAMRHKRKIRGRQYVIVPGDTLSEIAQRHQVSLSRLKDFNQLGQNDIRAGQVLKIPAES